MAVHVETINAPAETTAALIEPRIVTAEDVQSSNVPKAFDRLVIARTVCRWSAVNKTAMVQIANPSNRRVYLEKNTILGCTSKVKAVPKLNVSTLQSEKQSSVSTPEELRGALKKDFTSTTFSSDQCSQILDLCAKYRSFFSLSSTW